MTPACKLCGTWRCLDCGASRPYANRFSERPQLCPSYRCRSENGEMLPVVHSNKGKRLNHDSTFMFMMMGKTPRYPLEEK